MKVFISHSSADKKFVRTLKECLLLNSIDVWLDEDQIELGDNLLGALEYALDTSSHLIIVLSPASVGSEWVRLELKRALSNRRTGLIQKIIPIKYRDCPIPEDLGDLLYADLSNEVVLPSSDSEKVRFLSEGFDSFFLRLVRSLRNPSKQISKTEKDEIIKSIRISDQDSSDFSANVHRGIYELIGYESSDTLRKYQHIIYDGNKNLNAQEIRPFHLPASLKSIFNPGMGEKIIIEGLYPFTSYGHFAGHRTDDLKIAIDKRIRNELHISLRNYYEMEIDVERKVIRFLGRFTTLPDKFPFLTGQNTYAMAA